jgi:hypothetical protein
MAFGSSFAIDSNANDQFIYSVNRVNSFRAIFIAAINAIPIMRLRKQKSSHSKHFALNKQAFFREKK